MICIILLCTAGFLLILMVVGTLSRGRGTIATHREIHVDQGDGLDRSAMVTWDVTGEHPRPIDIKYRCPKHHTYYHVTCGMCRQEEFEDRIPKY